MNKEVLINGYFEGSLSADQLEEVRQLLASDSEFAAEFEFQKELQISLKKEERRDLRVMFTNLSEEKSRSKDAVFHLRPWLVAASIALIIGLASWFLFFNTSELNTDQLYAANFVPYDNVVHPIERGNQLEDLKTRAFTAYENEEYVEALQLFKELHVKQNDSYIDFYSAMVLMQLQLQEEAIPMLQGYIEKDGALKERAMWYLALAHLKMNEITKSKEQLQILAEQKGFKSEASEKLLEQLP